MHKEVYILAGGGSGGHLYPGLAVAQVLRRLAPEAEVLFLATQRDIDRHILTPSGFAWRPQPIQPLPRRPGAVWPFWQGWRRSLAQCRALLRDRPVAAVLGLGGFASGPMMRVARRAGVPVAMLNPDAVPGRANRWARRYAERIFLQWEASRAYFGGEADKCVVTGCPIRPGFAPADPARQAAARQALHLAADKAVLAVMGGSQGGRNVNDAVVWALSHLPAGEEWANWQKLHLTGAADEARVRRAYAQAGVAATVLAFSHEMPAVLQAADLVVGRAGASTLAELTAAARPSILIPYPYHRDQHQLRNAEVLARLGAAVIVPDEKDAARTGRGLVKALEAAIIKQGRLAQLSAAAGELSKPQAAEAVAAALLALAGRTHRDAGRPPRTGL